MNISSKILSLECHEGRSINSNYEEDKNQMFWPIFSRGL